jgi:hypothetical protein
MLNKSPLKKRKRYTKCALRNLLTYNAQGLGLQAGHSTTLARENTNFSIGQKLSARAKAPLAPNPTLYVRQIYFPTFVNFRATVSNDEIKFHRKQRSTYPQC